MLNPVFDGEIPSVDAENPCRHQAAHRCAVVHAATQVEVC
jgi:hypothetical protein